MRSNLLPNTPQNNVSATLGKSSRISDTNKFVQVAHENHEQKLDLLPSPEAKKFNFTNEHTTVKYYSTGCQTLYREKSAQTEIDSTYYHILDRVKRVHENNTKKFIELSDSTKTFDILRSIQWAEWLTHERNWENGQMAHQKVVEYMLKDRTRKTAQTSYEIIEEAIDVQMQTKNDYLKHITMNYERALRKMKYCMVQKAALIEEFR